MTYPFAVLFDLNGVIVDDLPYHKKAWFEFCRLHGFELSERDFDHKISGRKNEEIFHMLFGDKFSPEDVLRYSEEKEARYRELYAPDVKPVEGVMEFLQSLRSAEIPRAIATGAPPVNVSFIVEPLGLDRFFSVIVDASQVKNGKPDPEVFLAAADKLGVEPSNCVVFEDAVLGLEAAGRAGM